MKSNLRIDLVYAGQVFKIYLKFRRAEIPPNFDVEHTGNVFLSQCSKGTLHEYHISPVISSSIEKYFVVVNSLHI